MEAKHQSILRENLPYLCKTLDPQVLLAFLPCLSQPTQEMITATQNNNGKFRGMMKLHEYLICNPQAWNQLMTALRHPDMDLAYVANKLDPQPRQEPKESLPQTAPSSNRTIPEVCPKLHVSDGKKMLYDGNTGWNDLKAGVREILKQLDHCPGPDKLVGELGFTNKEYQDIKTHRKGESFALALIEEWNSREEATLGKLMKVIRNIDRKDVLKDLVKYTEFKLPDDTHVEEEMDNGKPDGDVMKGTDEECRKSGRKSDSVMSESELSAPIIISRKQIDGQRQEDVPQVLVYSKFPEQDRSQPDWISGEIMSETMSEDKIMPAIGLSKMLLDRSLSLDLRTPVLEPFTVASSSGQTEPLVMKESNNDSDLHITESGSHVSPVETGRDLGIPNFVQVHCVQQESQNPGEYKPITGNNRHCEWTDQPSLDRTQTLGSEGHIVLEGPRPHDRCMEANLFLPGEIISEYTTNVEIRNLREDSVNNNSSTETLLFPSATNCQCIIREDRMNRLEQCMEDNVKDIQSINKGGLCELKPEARNNSLSSFDSTEAETSHLSQDTKRSDSLLSCEEKDGVHGNYIRVLSPHVTEGCSLGNFAGSNQERSSIHSTGEMSSILKKANKYFPEARAGVYNSEEEYLESLTSSGNSMSLDVNEDDLFGSPSTDCRDVGYGFPFVLNRGTSDMVEPVSRGTNGITSELTDTVHSDSNEFQKHLGTRRDYENHGQSLVGSNVLVDENLNNACNATLNINDGGHETITELAGDIVSQSHTKSEHKQQSSVLKTVLDMAYSESDSLPWKQLISVAGLTAAIMKRKLRDPDQ